MANMSYCRFRNTLLALQDCYDTMMEEGEKLSPEEETAKDKLIVLCTDVVEDLTCTWIHKD